jgi:hypothetical protein
MNDSDVLRAAAEILQRRSTKPNSFLLRVLIRVLQNTADNATTRHGEPMCAACGARIDAVAKHAR